MSLLVATISTQGLQSLFRTRRGRFAVSQSGQSAINNSGANEVLLVAHHIKAGPGRRPILNVLTPQYATGCNIELQDRVANMERKQD